MSKATRTPASAGRFLLTIVLVLGIAGAVLLLLARPRPTLTPTIVAVRDLPAYTRLTGADLTVASRPAAGTVFTDTAAAIGRITLSAVTAQDALTPANTVALPAGAWLMSVPLTAQPLQVAPGAAVLLLHGNDAPLPATFVAGDKTSATVAVSPADGQRLAAWLAFQTPIILARQP